MFYYRWKNFICTALAVGFCLLATLSIRAANTVLLADLKGERTFYLDSASSQGLRKSSLSIGELHRVKGECVRLDLTAQDGGKYALNEEFALEIIRAYGAEIVFKEETCGQVSYYCYTPRFDNGLLLYGQRVNLHVAVGENACTVGTPIIFDGF